MLHNPNPWAASCASRTMRVWAGLADIHRSATPGEPGDRFREHLDGFALHPYRRTGDARDVAARPCVAGREALRDGIESQPRWRWGSSLVASSVAQAAADPHVTRICHHREVDELRSEGWEWLGLALGKAVFHGNRVALHIANSCSCRRKASRVGSGAVRESRLLTSNAGIFAGCCASAAGCTMSQAQDEHDNAPDGTAPHGLLLSSASC